MSSITDVAARAGVSVATVSRALRGLPGVAASTRVLVEGAAAELGYVASPSAAGLPTGRTGTIGVVVPWLGRWFFTSVIEGAQQVFVEHAYDVLLYDVGTSVDAHRRELDTKLLSKRVDALLVMSLPLSAREVLALGRLHRPVAMVGPAIPGLSGVRIDDVAAGYAATKHLLDLGHRRIAFAGGDPHDHLGFPVAPDRQLGYEQALAGAGLTADPRLALPARFCVDDGIAAATGLLAHSDLPTAIVAASDEIAMGILYAFGRGGVRVPDDISVVGVDDHDLSRLFDLTTVAQPVREQGRIAAGLLVDRLLSAESQRQVVTVPTHLVVRGTTAAPGSSGRRDRQAG
jgi:LacI family transcriptional regulator, repressor for deo operon, udp, cdd, tsx, nupC, and nupG